MKTRVGVLGYGSFSSDVDERARLDVLAANLGKAIAERHCLVVCGACGGVVESVAASARKAGAECVGISPAANEVEHLEKFGMPLREVDFAVYSGFGLIGRQVLIARNSDIVVLIGGGLGALGEFLLSAGEKRVCGVLEGSGGAADCVRGVLNGCASGGSKVLFSHDPEVLLRECLEAFCGER